MPICSPLVLASLNRNFIHLLLLGRDVKRESKRPLSIFQPLGPLEGNLHKDLRFLTSCMWAGQLKLDILPPVSWKLLWSGHSPPGARGSSGVCQGGDEYLWPQGSLLVKKWPSLPAPLKHKIVSQVSLYCQIQSRRGMAGVPRAPPLMLLSKGQP